MRLRLLTLAVLVVVIAGSAWATGEQITWQVVSSGGGRSTSSSYIVTATVGQTATGNIASVSNKVKQGFWQDFGSSGGCCIGTTGNVDGDGAGVVDISDLSAMVDYLFFSGSISSCFEENDVDASGSIDISDLQALIDFLFFSMSLPSC